MGWEDELIKSLEEEIEKDKKSTLYNKEFYQNHMKYKPVYDWIGQAIFEGFKPNSVMDFGCGCGFLLEKLHTLGMTHLRGIDSSEDAISACNSVISEYVEVRDAVLFDSREKFDMTVCMEVAEHIKPANSEKLVTNIAKQTGKFIWWTAAPPGQGGDGHINCKDICFWASLFEGNGFLPIWKTTYEIKSLMLQNIPEFCVSFPWFRDNVVIFKRLGNR